MASHGAGQSGTGVFYQAMPAVGADGRNVIQLIPVQKINGQFVPSQTSPPTEKAVEPRRAVVMNFASAPVVRSIEHSNNGVKKLFSLNGPPNPGKVTVQCPGDILQQNSLMQCQASTSRTPQVVFTGTTPSKCGKLASLLNTNKLPLTVKSPVLPNGQYLQIPPNAQVKTLPMSALPLGIKRHIFTSSDNSASTSKLPTVLYVSPVTTMNPCSSQTGPSPSPSRLQKTSEHTPFASSTSIPSTWLSRTVAKDGPNPVTPMKWIIEEQDDSPAPCLVPVNPSFVASDILKTVAKIEKANKAHETTAEKPLTPQKTQTKMSQGKDNALVMCNGKVYFVAMKTPELCKLMAKPLENIGSSCRSSHGANALPSVHTNTSVESQVSGTTRSNSNPIVILDGPDDVIDLCDDDPQDDFTLQARSTSKHTELFKTKSVAGDDEDSNVIFVSYSPPKSISGLGIQKMEKDPVNNSNACLKTVRSQDTVTKQNDIGTVGCLNAMSNRSRSTIGVTQDLGVSEVSPTLSEKLNTSHQDSIASQELENCLSSFSSAKMKESHALATDMTVKILVDSSVKETGPSHNVGINQEIVENKAIHREQGTEIRDPDVTSQQRESTNSAASVQAKMDAIQNQSSIDPIPDILTSVIDQESRETVRQMRRMFGITSDVKICLERVDDRKSVTPLKVLPQIGPISQSALEGIRKLILGSKININKRKHETQECSKQNIGICPKDTKIQKTENAPIASAGSEKTKASFISSNPKPEKCLLNVLEGTEHSQDFFMGFSSQMEMSCVAEADQRFNPEEAVSSNRISTTAECKFPVIPLSVFDSAQVPKPSLDLSVPFIQPQTNKPNGCSVASNTLKTESEKRRRKQRKCTTCPCETHEQDFSLRSLSPVKKRMQRKCTTCPSETHDQDFSLRLLSPSSEIPCPSKLPDCTVSTTPELFRHSDGLLTIAPCQDINTASVETQCIPTLSEQCSSTVREIATGDLFSTAPMDPDEIRRHEKIRRLKELVREKEAALEMLRKNKSY